VSYTTAEGYRQIMDALAGAVEHLSTALGELEGAYDLLDERTADELEDQLFRPVQLAYGRAQRTYSEFATRHELEVRAFESASPGAPARGAKGLIESAVSSAAEADRELSELQDSMVPVEVGDAELRAGLEQVREQITGLANRARNLLRTLGR
jgi:hypothetical protein